MGVLPTERDATDEQLQAFEDAILAVPEPLSLDEARALSALFGSDDCFGLSWTLLHKIETCGEWVPPPDPTNKWRMRLWERWANAHE